MARIKAPIEDAKEAKTNSRRNSGHQDADAVPDARFASVHNDPKFLRPKKKDMKIKIDERFKAMLKSTEFSSGPKVDKYGRNMGQTHAQELERLYTFEGDSDHAKDDGNNAESSDAEDEDERISTVIDRARGKGIASSSEDEDESEEVYTTSLIKNKLGLEEDSTDDESVFGQDDENPEEDILDKADVPLGEETYRFAAVNMDWDNLKAVDLFKAFDSLKPQGSVVKSVKIYISEFGKQRIERESREGPPAEVFQTVGSRMTLSDEEDSDKPHAKLYGSDDGSDSGNVSHIKDDDGKDFDPVKLRRYQLERLRYYYAVAEFDSVEAAKAVYTQCENAELEKTSNFFDLRYIPDDMTFDDEESRDVATSVPVSYKPNIFETQAMQHTAVKLTWDEDDLDRTKITRKKLSKNEIKELDFKSFLASDTDSDGEQVDTIAKYRALLLGGDNKEHSVSANDEMEVTFTPGLTEAAEQLLHRKTERDALKHETTVEKYLRKEKERKKKRREGKQMTGENDISKKDVVVSTPVNDLGFDDPFFTEDPKMVASDQLNSGKPHKHGIDKLTTPSTSNGKDQQEPEPVSAAELSLMMMDDTFQTTKQHFDLKTILKSEKNAKGKKRKGKKNDVQADEEKIVDNFAIDTNDSRFNSLFEHHEFAIDPNNPQFKKTKAMQQLLNEKAKSSARMRNNTEAGALRQQGASKENISHLIDSVKRKTARATEEMNEGIGRRKKTKLL